jgi:hypothetical protein
MRSCGRSPPARSATTAPPTSLEQVRRLIDRQVTEQSDFYLVQQQSKDERSRGQGERHGERQWLRQDSEDGEYFGR